MLACSLGVVILPFVVRIDSCVGGGIVCDVWFFLMVFQSCVLFVLWFMVLR